MIYIDPSQTAESLGACVTWCIRLMSEKEFLELVSTILDPSVWESVPETAEDKHQQFVSISYLCLRLLEEYGEGVVRDIVLNVVMDIHHPLCLINMLTEERARIFYLINSFGRNRKLKARDEASRQNISFLDFRREASLQFLKNTENN
jgi:hypothetical protein